MEKTSSNVKEILDRKIKANNPIGRAAWNKHWTGNHTNKCAWWESRKKKE